MRKIVKFVGALSSTLALLVFAGQVSAKKLTMNIGYSVNEAHPWDPNFPFDLRQQREVRV